MTTIYRAYDGSEFETEEQCIEYEEGQLFICLCNKYGIERADDPNDANIIIVPSVNGANVLKQDFDIPALPDCVMFWQDDKWHSCPTWVFRRIIEAWDCQILENF